MTEKEIAVLLMAGASFVLYGYGSIVAWRIHTTVIDRYGNTPRWIPSPLLSPLTMGRYRQLAEEDRRLPRLHRSLRLNQMLLVVAIVATVVRILG